MNEQGQKAMQSFTTYTDFLTTQNVRNLARIGELEKALAEANRKLALIKAARLNLRATRKAASDVLDTL